MVGVVHLLPLPGSVRGGSTRDLGVVIDRARADAAAYAAGGADAVIVENFGDVPFSAGMVGPHVVAAMTVAVAAVRAESGLPVGVNVLRNDVLSAVAVAAMAGGSFVRANVYVGATVTDQGIVEGRAEEVQLLIRRLGAPVSVWADVDVKHASPLAARPLAEVAADAVERGLAAAVVVTGRGTGRPVDIGDLSDVSEAVPSTPVFVGSGATASRGGALLPPAYGVIVGTAAKRDGEVSNPVDVRRVEQIVTAARQSVGRQRLGPV